MRLAPRVGGSVTENGGLKTAVGILAASLITTGVIVLWMYWDYSRALSGALYA